MVKQLNILIVEKHILDAEVPLATLHQAGYEPTWQCATTEREFLRQITSCKFDVVLIKYNLSQCTLQRVIDLLHQYHIHTPFIVLIDTMNTDIVTECLNAGATDCIFTFCLTLLGPAVERILKERELHADKRHAEEKLKAAAEEVQHLRRQQTEIGRLASAWGSASDLEQLYGFLYRHLRRLFDTDAFFIFSKTPGRRELQATFAILDDEVLCDQYLPSFSRTPDMHKAREQVFKMGDPLYLRNLSQLEWVENQPYFNGAQGNTLWPDTPKFYRGSAILAPIKHGQRTVSLIQVHSYHANAYTSHDTRLLLAMADIIGIIEQKGKLVEDLQKSNAELSHDHSILSQKLAEQTSKLRLTAAELSRATRAKEEFLGTMNHELRTPLTSILGQSELLMEGIHGPLSQEQTSSVRTINSNGQNLLSVINDILELSNLESGKTDLEISPVSVAYTCKLSLQGIQRLAEEKYIRTSFGADTNSATVFADEQLLCQIIIKLLSNAVKFTPEGSEIGIEVRDDELQEVVHIIVWDQGIGIMEEQMSRLFKPFTQLDSSLSRNHEGTGLGLSLAYRLTEIQGGSIAVSSRVGRGSRFTISLPRADVDLSITEDSHAVWQGGHSGRKQQTYAHRLSILPASGLTSGNSTQILLAEHNETTVGTLMEPLLYVGYKVDVAWDGIEAIEIAEAKQPDLIIIDLQMPRLDGLEVIQHLRAEPHFESTPIIALTALTRPGDRELCLDAGADEYLRKPLSPLRLIHLIESLLNKPKKVKDVPPSLPHTLFSEQDSVNNNWLVS